jgi:hypothetical protein
MRRKARRAGAVHDNLDVGQLPAGDLAGVDQAGGGDDRRAVLVVVEDRDVEFSRSSLSMMKHSGALMSSRLMPPKVAPMLRDAVDEFCGSFGRHLDVDRIDVGEALEQDALAFHHRLGRHCAQIAEAQDRRAVGDHGHQVALGGVVVGQLRSFGDRQHRNGHARRIGQRQVRCVAIGLVGVTDSFPGCG